MEVKIYREPENKALLIDEDYLSEYNRLVSELGISPVQEETKIPSVYIPLNEVQRRTISAICGREVPYQEYKRSTIPVEVLQVIKTCVDNQMFDKIEIWYDEKQIDPVVIGLSFASDSARDNGHTWNMNRSLIARWGDCAMEFEDLLRFGFERKKQQLIDSATNLKLKAQNFIENPDIFTRKALDEGQANFQSISF